MTDRRIDRRWLVALVAGLPLLFAVAPTGVGLQLEIGEPVEFPDWVVPFNNAAVASDGERIYVVGGSNDQVEGCEKLDQALAIDPVTGRFDELEDFPYGIAGASAAVLGGYLYVSGGNGFHGSCTGYSEWWSLSDQEVLARWPESTSGGSNGQLALLWRLDLDTPDPQWERRESMHVPRNDHALLAWGGELVALGGAYHPDGETVAEFNDQGCFPEGKDSWLAPGTLDCSWKLVEFYDPSADRWRLGEEGDPGTRRLEVNRNQLVAAAPEDVLVVAGGGNAGGYFEAGRGPARFAERLGPDDEGFAWTAAPPEPIALGYGTDIEHVAWLYSEASLDLPPRLFGYDVRGDQWVVEGVPRELDLHRPGVVGVGDTIWIVSGWDVCRTSEAPPCDFYSATMTPVRPILDSRVEGCSAD